MLPIIVLYHWSKFIEYEVFAVKLQQVVNNNHRDYMDNLRNTMIDAPTSTTAALTETTQDSIRNTASPTTTTEVPITMTAAPTITTAAIITTSKAATTTRILTTTRAAKEQPQRLLQLQKMPQPQQIVQQL